MSEHQAFASLTPRLLARKGGAKPAMRRQDAIKLVTGAGSAPPEDLGWNDWGHGNERPRESVPVAAPVAVPAPVQEAAPSAAAPGGEVPEVLRQIEQIAWRINQSFPPPQPSAPEGRRAAFTLRLDAERHFRLKMAAVVLNRSAQVLVTEALDKYLSEIPEVAQLQGSGGTGR
ncbi:hypothetical protein [Novosphingobium album (ex Hu et al. 2023)]|uniref:Uncharacterized protein n=1 Tax=Novosphingobium album (ex Hu et al. 2023) TaxID=2930093 RepID=A0ABT0AWY7_9SPHN|nr:hypothetical protein [Novosphingobium album (ex Hu et al. 2023)]MCJ2177297.1 hypothetical protein [Novosphingobium album (ex Hu et al. 2023)]